MKYLFYTIAIVSFITASYFVLNEGFKRQEKYECAKLERYSQQYKDFYWTDWQWEMCHPNKIKDTNVLYRNDKQKYED